MIKDAEGPLPFGEEERYSVLGGRRGVGKGKIELASAGTGFIFNMVFQIPSCLSRLINSSCPTYNGQKMDFPYHVIFAN